MINLTRRQIDSSLRRVELEAGLNKYCWLQGQLHKVNVATYREYQKRFNGFYVVRRRDEWQKHFYSLMEAKKKSGTLFDGVLKIIKAMTGRYEASFVSKLVATIDPTYPVIDKFVLNNLQLKLPYAYAKKREKRICDVYQKVCRMFDDYLKTDSAKYLVAEFKGKYPWADITEVKMVDLVLWQTR